MSPLDARDANVAARMVASARNAGRLERLRAQVASAELDYDTDGYRPHTGQMHPRTMRALRAELDRT